jgi:hypothetical protein
LFEQALKLVRIQGALAFITPAPFTTNNYTTNLRKLILESVKILRIVTVPDGVFADASVDNVIFAFQKEAKEAARNSNEIDFVEAAAGDERLIITDSRKVIQKTFLETSGMIFRPPKVEGFASFESKLLKHTKPLSDYARVNFGMQLRDRSKFPEDVVETDNPKSLKSAYKPCITGKNVSRYSTEFANLYCLFDREAQQGGCWDEEIQFAKGKVIVRQIGEIPIASFDAKGFCCLNTVFMVKAIVPHIEEKFLLGILNSKVIGFFWTNKFADFKQTFPKIKGTYLLQMPIPALDLNSKSDKDRHDKLVALVDKMLVLVPKLRAATSDRERETLQNAVTATDYQIDQLVYDLYGLTEKEVSLVEGNN